MSPDDQRADRPPAIRPSVVLLAVLGIAMTGALVMSPAAAQDPGGQGAVPPVTIHQLLDGPTTAVPLPTTAAPDSVSRTGPVKTKSADTKKVWAVVATLVFVAACLFLLTLLYVRRTRPEPPEDDRRPEPSSPPERTRNAHDQPRPPGPRDWRAGPPEARAAAGTGTAGPNRVAGARTPRPSTPGGGPDRARTGPSARRGPPRASSGPDVRAPVVRRQPPPLRRRGAPAQPRRSAG